MNNEQCKDHIKYGKGKAIKYFTSSLTNNQSKSIYLVCCARAGLQVQNLGQTLNTPDLFLAGIWNQTIVRSMGGAVGE